jgi:2-polyprenyl-3-methyl-5-hydroxy-6-metoxy-1,4-benzoquinol methylase
MKSRERAAVDLHAIKKMNQEFWEACFDNPDYDYRKLTERDWSPLVQWLHENGVRDILDLGCGYGHWSIVLARAGFVVRAVDYARSAIENLRRWAAEESLSVECDISDIRDVNYTCEFDAVICNSVLDHMLMHDASVAIEKIRCACKKGRIAYVSFDGPGEQSDEFLALEDGRGNI